MTIRDPQIANRIPSRGVTSVSGTANQITAATSNGAVTLSVPQNFILSGTLPKLELRETSSTANVDIFLGQNGTDGEGLRIRYESGSGHSYLNNIYNLGNLIFQTNSITSFIIDASGNVIHKRNGSGYWQESTGTWGGDPGAGIGKFEYHSNRWYIGAGSNSTEILRIRRGGVDEVSIDNDGTVRAYAYCGNENVGGTGTAAWFPSGLYSSSGASAWIYGTKYFGYGSIYADGYHWSNGPTGLTDANAISCTNWFRSTGGSGWYNATYQGGIYMEDSTWVRIYNSKNFYTPTEIRAGNIFSGNHTNNAALLRMLSGHGTFFGWYGYYALYVDGTHVKTFVIDHPTKPDNYLVHACAEGPTSDVFYRGEAELKNGICVVTLPDYFESLTEKHGRTVMITPIADENGPAANLAAYEIEDGQFVVEQIGGYHVPFQRFWWRVDAIRKNTEFEVEPSRATHEVAGDGPYTYLKKKVA